MKPKLAPGFYRWPTGRVYAHTELRVVKHDGRWCVAVKATRKAGA